VTSGPGTLVLVAVATLTTACASTGAVPRPFPMPGAAAPPSAGAAIPPPNTGNAPPPRAGNVGRNADGGGLDTYALTGTAMALRGTRYRDGGNGPDGFDCSGFTQYVFGQQGLALPRDVKNQFGIGQPVIPAEIAPGDLIFFSTVGAGASHVGIALGGDAFIHAPSSAGVVRIEHLTTAYWSQRFVGARRVG
jgi:cell wall-associated NlpC family hydrolase